MEGGGGVQPSSLHKKEKTKKRVLSAIQTGLLVLLSYVSEVCFSLQYLFFSHQISLDAIKPRIYICRFKNVFIDCFGTFALKRLEICGLVCSFIVYMGRYGLFLVCKSLNQRWKPAFFSISIIHNQGEFFPPRRA